MKLKLRDEKTGGDLLLFKEEDGFDRLYFSRDRSNKYFTIAWNPGESQIVIIDGTEYEFLPNSLVTLLFDQSFSFERPADIVAWQFNREFYCIIDHDSEVSCVGFLFGTTDHLFIQLDEHAQQKLKLLLDVFIEEFKTSDNIQNEMLLVLLKRLIIYVTRLARSEYVPIKKNTGRKISYHPKIQFVSRKKFSFRTLGKFLCRGIVQVSKNYLQSFCYL
ncbi:MAG TPA: hypothetical protein VK705_03110 [Ferruginibacter sp.]|jgi:AraC family transcriptional activator of pobA|nr:hypothetical protein [Ferruginibacter sp.]